MPQVKPQRYRQRTTKELRLGTVWSIAFCSSDIRLPTLLSVLFSSIGCSSSNGSIDVWHCDHFIVEEEANCFACHLFCILSFVYSSFVSQWKTMMCECGAYWISSLLFCTWRMSWPDINGCTRVSVCLLFLLFIESNCQRLTCGWLILYLTNLRLK